MWPGISRLAAPRIRGYGDVELWGAPEAVASNSTDLDQVEL